MENFDQIKFGITLEGYAAQGCAHNPVHNPAHNPANLHSGHVLEMSSECPVCFRKCPGHVPENVPGMSWK